MHQQLHPKYTHSFIDSCAFNPIDKDEALCSRRLLDKSYELGLLLQIAHSIQKEIDHPNTPKYVKELAQNLIYTIKTELTNPEKEKRDEIRALIRGNAKIGKHEKDADHTLNFINTVVGILLLLITDCSQTQKSPQRVVG